ncbi:GFA family protein [Alphaproteobacteria bacterium LSUCC0684]
MANQYKTGRCACGKVVFEARLPHEKSIICHCKSCQLRTGSVFGLMIYFKRGQLSFPQHLLSLFQYRAESGNAMQSHFCKECGTSLFLTGALNAGLIGVAGGCFDNDLSWCKIDREIFCRSKADFVHVNTAVSLETSPRYKPKKV